ncbi:MAG: dipeptide/oligopeptide/nickel ABC transporter ATP-binding protein [Desulfobacteraceae bacterium]
MLKFKKIHKIYSNGLGRPKNIIVNGLSFAFTPQRIIGLVGPSGSGKSTLGRMILRLEKPDQGHIFFEGEDIWRMPRVQLKRFRGKVQMVPQHPDAAFNPRLKLGTSIREVFRFHRVCPAGEEDAFLNKVLTQVMVHRELLQRYPSQLSGGEIQRLAIARAILTKPSFLILDEVTSMLDVSVQAAVIRTLEGLHQERAATYLFITHNLALARVFCHEIYGLVQGRLEQLT